MLSVVAQHGFYHRWLDGSERLWESKFGWIRSDVSSALTGRTIGAAACLAHTPGNGEFSATKVFRNSPGEIDHENIRTRRHLATFLGSEHFHILVVTIAAQYHPAIHALVEPYGSVRTAFLPAVVMQQSHFAATRRGHIDIAVVDPSVVAVLVIDRHLDFQLVCTYHRHLVARRVLHLVRHCRLRQQ